MRAALLLTSALLISVCVADVPAAQTAALVDLYTATSTTSWFVETNWNILDPCTNNWFGITCNGAQNSVIEINLPSNNLSGVLPASLVDGAVFTDLEIL